MKEGGRNEVIERCADGISWRDAAVGFEDEWWDHEPRNGPPLETDCSSKWTRLFFTTFTEGTQPHINFSQ